ncbi:MAG: hypothetical protein V1900_01985 [Candidatus Aenigmatarchaeota archaeon]
MRLMLFLLFLFAFSSIAFADFSINTYGECRDFNVVIYSESTQCFDVKLDVDGTILSGDEWKSTFFYVNDALCGGIGTKKLHLSSDLNMTGIAKFRSNGTIVDEKPFAIVQNCPDTKNEFFIAAITVAILLLAIVLFFRKK